LSLDAKFAPDSPLEGDGFEPSVPLVESGRLSRTGGSEIDVALTAGAGTEGSNPSPSSGESIANLAFGSHLGIAEEVIPLNAQQRSMHDRRSISYPTYREREKIVGRFNGDAYASCYYAAADDHS
jgi:hypothetical protein